MPWQLQHQPWIKRFCKKKKYLKCYINWVPRIQLGILALMAYTWCRRRKLKCRINRSSLLIMMACILQSTLSSNGETRSLRRTTRFRRKANPSWLDVQGSKFKKVGETKRRSIHKLWDRPSCCSRKPSRTRTKSSRWKSITPKCPGVTTMWASSKFWRMIKMRWRSTARSPSFCTFYMRPRSRSKVISNL